MYFHNIKLSGLKKKERKKKSIKFVRKKRAIAGMEPRTFGFEDKALTPRDTRTTEIPLRTDGWANTDVDIMRIGYKADTPRELRL